MQAAAGASTGARAISVALTTSAAINVGTTPLSVARPSTLPSTPPPTLLPTSAAGYHVTMCSVQARRDLLILPRSQLSGPGALDSQHLPLVRSMSRH